jgi:hypothetical protein
MVPVTGIVRWLILWAISLQQPPNSAEQAQKLPSFQEYPVAQIYHGKPATPVFRTKEELEYVTRIRRGAAKGPNFAGHYAVVEWGGGTGTGGFVFVDVKTGQIFFHAQPPGTGPGFMYNLGSRLMVSDSYTGPPDSQTTVRSFWEWTGKELKFIAKTTNPKGLPEGFNPSPR